MAKDSPSMVFPVAIVEATNKNPYTGMYVVFRRAQFLTLGRMPNDEKYRDGRMYDAQGNIYSYSGCAGWPRFHPKTCIILEWFLIPGLIMNAVSFAVYLGPRITSVEHVEVDDFRESLIESVAVFGNKSLPELVGILKKRTSYETILLGLEQWRYFGDDRDSDGHPKYSEKGTTNPEHSP